MAALTIQTLSSAGTAPTFSAATTSDTTFYGSGHNTFVVYKNGDSASHTLTVDVGGATSYGVANPDATFTIPATTGQVWIPLNAGYDDGNGLAEVTLTLDAATSVTVAVVRLP
jgi:hypothetical protein